MASRGARCTLSRGARLLRSAGVQQAHPCPFVGSTHVAPPLTHSSGSSSGERNPDELIMLIRGHKKTAALSGPERVSGIESPREALRLGIAARAPEQREHSGVLIANEQSAVVQARAAECSGMARVGAARASAQRCAHAAAALATSHGQRRPERGHSSCLFQRGTLGGRPVGWGEETTVVRRHSPEHGFLRGVVELALELAHLEVRWSRGRCARRDVCVHTTISTGRRLCFLGEDRFFARALHLSHKQGRAVPQARAQVPPHTGP